MNPLRRFWRDFAAAFWLAYGQARTARLERDALQAYRRAASIAQRVGLARHHAQFEAARRRRAWTQRPSRRVH